MKLEEITKNLQDAVDRYHAVPLIEVYDLSQILRDLGCNLAYLTTLRKEYYIKYQNIVINSKGSSQAAKIKEADYKIPELDEIRKILRHYGELQKDIRSQISLWKTHEN